MLRRRKKRALVLLGVCVVGGALGLRYLSSGTERYTAGERPDGLADRLAQQAETPGPDLAFTEVAAETGLDFRHFPGTRSNRLPEDMGSGVALGDFDGDGWTDAFLTNSTGPMEAGGAPANGARSRLFQNLRGRFVDVTQESGIDLTAQAMGAAFCDVDSDGDLDLFVTTYGTCRLYTNEGGGRFADTSVRAGLDAHEGFWTGIGVGDYDLDGALDIYVCGYVEYVEASGAAESARPQYGVSIPAQINPSNFEPAANLLLNGNGDGTFRERGAEAGAADPAGRSLGVVFSDLNADGLPDLYVANDVSDNALLLNRGDGTFADRTSQALVGDYRGAMGLAAADFDGDADLDLFITHWVAQENALYAQTGLIEASVEGGDAGDGGGGPAVPLYFDEADRQRLGFQGLRMVGWATRFVDIDNDTRLDLFVVNGSTIPLAEDPARLEPMRSQLFWNSGGPDRYVEVGEEQGGFFAQEHVGRGGATFDYDLDGDEDLLVMLHGERAALLRNDGGNARAAVRLRLRQPEGNRFALGAEVTATVGDTRLFDVVGTQGSYLSQHAVGELAFGLGDAAVVRELEVRWPDGERERAGPILANSLVSWTRGKEPRVTPLPGRDVLDREGPQAVLDQRAFYALRKQARAALLAGEAEDSAALYQQALARWPGHADCLYSLGNCLLATGDERAALDAFERLVHFDERSSPGWMQIGMMRLPGGDAGLDDLDAAEAAFERCQALNREESRPVMQLGIVAFLRGDLERAGERFLHVTRQNPRSVEARWFAGQVAYLTGDRGLAEQWLEEARALSGTLSIGEVGAESASNEGDTLGGAAMTAEPTIELSPELVRWRGVGQRSGGVDAEFGALE